MGSTPIYTWWRSGSAAYEEALFSGMMIWTKLRSRKGLSVGLAR